MTIKIVPSTISFADQGEAADALEAAGYPTDTAGNSYRQVAAMAWIVTRRTDPTFTIEEALKLTTADIEIVTEAPEVSGGNGTSPPLSPESGPSTPPT